MGSCFVATYFTDGANRPGHAHIKSRLAINIEGTKQYAHTRLS